MVTIERHLETGRKMINQYLVSCDSLPVPAHPQVLDLLGRGAHGDVRRGRDMSFHETTDEDHDEAAAQYVVGLPHRTGSLTIQAIKMVKRTGKKTLSGFTQQRLAKMRQGNSPAEGE
jgi:hypothetical protein